VSTFLQLAVKTRKNVRGTGSGPTSVSNQSGEYGRIVDWVADAYKEIQQRHSNWRWLRSRFNFNTVASTDTYAYTAVTDSRLSATITRFLRWITVDNDGLPNVTAYLTSGGVSGENHLIFLPWSIFRSIYKFGAQSALTGQPVHYTVDPQNKLVLGPNPSGIYTIQGEYQMSPQILAADADEPEMPAEFHDVIMYRAMEKLAIDGAAVERLDRAIIEGGRMMRSLERSQLDGVRLGRPMA